MRLPEERVSELRAAALEGDFGPETSKMLHEQNLTAIIVTAISGGALTLIFATTTIMQWARG